MNSVSIFIATVLDVPFFCSKEGGVSILDTQYSVCTSHWFSDEFLAQGLHLKSHQKCSTGIRRPVKFFHTD